MSDTKYSYSISMDFPNHKVDPDRLTQEIKSSSITIALACINTSGDECDIWFADELSAPEVVTLSSIIAAHQGDLVPWVDYAYAEFTKTKTTTNTEYESCLELSNDYVMSGTYLVEYTLSWYSSNSAAKLNVKVLLDNTVILMEESTKPRDVGTDSTERISGFGEHIFSAGEHNAKLYFATGKAKREVGIFNAAISFRRVS